MNRTTQVSLNLGSLFTEARRVTTHFKRRDAKHPSKDRKYWRTVKMLAREVEV
jgi:hypothetical protein